MKRILCYGDSNTWGHDPENGARRVSDEYRWGQVLQQKLGTEYCVIEEGLCGRRTAGDGVLNLPENRGWDGYEYFLPCIRSHVPLELVIIMIGTNDMQIPFDLQPEYTGEMLGKYIEAIEEVARLRDIAVPSVLLISPIAIDPAITENETFNEIFGAQSLPKSAKLAGIIEAVAKKYNVHYLRAEDYAKASKADGLHMNAENHKLVGEAVYNKVVNDIFKLS